MDTSLHTVISFSLIYDQSAQVNFTGIEKKRTFHFANFLHCLSLFVPLHYYMLLVLVF